MNMNMGMNMNMNQGMNQSMNLNPCEYSIFDDIIIIHNNVNKRIDFNKINERFCKIIFSDYDDIAICLRQNNKYNPKYFDNYIPSIFNQNIVLPNYLTNLIFGFSYNRPILSPLSEFLVSLIFGEEFNQFVELPNKLIQLAFGNSFNQCVTLPMSLTHLTLGHNFSQPIDLSILKIEYLTINSNNTYLIENLPNSLKSIIFDKNFVQPIYRFPVKIKSIAFLHDNYNENLNNLPNSIEKIELSKNYQKQIFNIPNNLKSIKCSHNYKYIDYFQMYKSANNLKFKIKIFEFY